jgi:hypothetical protein
VLPTHVLISPSTACSSCGLFSTDSTLRTAGCKLVLPLGLGMLLL